MSTPLLQLKKGVTTLVVLDALEDSEQYGYGLRREVVHCTRGAFDISEGALYPLLHSLQKRGLVKSSQRKVGGRSRTYYAITPKGRHALADFRREWKALLDSLEIILKRSR